MPAQGLIPVVFACAVVAAAASSSKPLLQDEVDAPEPHERTLLRVNPPTFRWPQTDGASSYELQISRLVTFEKAVSINAKTPFHRPLKPLEAGVWHWRVRPANGAWTASSFRIDPSLPRWEAPSTETAMARIPKARPRIYLRPEQVPQYRASAAGAMRASVRDWAADMERHIGEDPGAAAKGLKPRQLPRAETRRKTVCATRR